MSIEPTYKLETPPVAAMTWEEYEPLVLSEWADLLESQSVPESGSTPVQGLPTYCFATGAK